LYSKAGKGFICTGDTIQVTPDKMVSFMYRCVSVCEQLLIIIFRLTCPSLFAV